MHTKDSECIAEAEGRRWGTFPDLQCYCQKCREEGWTCPVCQVYHGDPCVDCGATGHHEPQCPQMSFTGTHLVSGE